MILELTQNSFGTSTDSVTVTVGGTSATLTPATTAFGSAAQQSVILTAVNNGPFSITNNGGGNAGPLVDNISLTH